MGTLGFRMSSSCLLLLHVLVLAGFLAGIMLFCTFSGWRQFSCMEEFVGTACRYSFSSVFNFSRVEKLLESFQDFNFQ